MKTIIAVYTALMAVSFGATTLRLKPTFYLPDVQDSGPARPGGQEFVWNYDFITQYEGVEIPSNINLISARFLMGERVGNVPYNDRNPQFVTQAGSFTVFTEAEGNVGEDDESGFYHSSQALPLVGAFFNREVKNLKFGTYSDNGMFQFWGDVALEVTFTTVPEPSALALVALASLGLLGRRR